MGCITGMVAKIFLTVFNAAVALTGIGVLTTAAITATALKNYGALVPNEPFQILDGLQSVAGFVICLGALGVLTVCCCHNKLFMYTYFGLGLCLVILSLTFASIGMANINNNSYEDDIIEKMNQNMDKYNFTTQTADNIQYDSIYTENKCCGIVSPNDWATHLPSGADNDTLPLGCCVDYSSTDAQGSCTNGVTNDIYTRGCYTALVEDVSEIADATVKLGIFFAIFLLALICSSCICVKCTDAMPI